jgi:hypothetical protein
VQSAEWGAAVLRVSRVAYAGVVLMFGAMGCTASADTTPTTQATATTPTTATATTTSTSTTTATATATATATRRAIDVQINPDRVTAGETSKVWILAACPMPAGGPAYTGTATSRAFVSGVTMNPTTTTATPRATGTQASTPWVRGEAQVGGTVRRGDYRVDVKCDGTNDTGHGTLHVSRATDQTSSPVPTRAPRAGGGGTYGKSFDDESSLPLGPAAVVIGLALVAGIAIAAKRRRA